MEHHGLLMEDHTILRKIAQGNVKTAILTHGDSSGYLVVIRIASVPPVLVLALIILQNNKMYTYTKTSQPR